MLVQKRNQRLFLILNMVMFFISMGEGLVTPMIPLYASELGTGYAQLGYLATGYSVTYLAFTLLSGKLSDQFNRRLVLLVGIVVNVMAAVVYFNAASFIVLLIGKSLEGLGRGIIWPVSEALITEEATEEERGKVAGNYMACYGAGVAGGTLLSGILMEGYGTVVIFMLNLSLVTVAMLGTLAVVEWRSAAGAAFNKTDYRESYSRQEGWKTTKRVFSICFTAYVFAGFLWTVWSLLSRMADIYGFSKIGIGVILALFWGMRFTGFLTSAKMELRLGRALTITMGLSFCLISSVLFSISTDFNVFLAGVIVGGLGTGWIFPACVAEIAARTTKTYRGLGMGLYETGAGLGYGIQPAISGLVGQTFGVQYTFWPVIGITLLAVLITLKSMKRQLSVQKTL